MTRNKKPEERSLYSSPPKEKGADKSSLSKVDQTYTSRYVYEKEASNTSRPKPSFKSKYAYTPDEDLIEIPKKELVSKKYGNEGYNFRSAAAT